MRPNARVASLSSIVFCCDETSQVRTMRASFDAERQAKKQHKEDGSEALTLQASSPFSHFREVAKVDDVSSMRSFGLLGGEAPRSCGLRQHTDTRRKTVAHRAQFRNGNRLRSFRCHPIHACRQSRRNSRSWPTLCRLWGHFCPSSRWRRNGRRSTSGCVDGLRRFPEVCCGAGFRLSPYVASKVGSPPRVDILEVCVAWLYLWWPGCACATIENCG